MNREPQSCRKTLAEQSAPTVASLNNAICKLFTLVAYLIPALISLEYEAIFKEETLYSVEECAVMVKVMNSLLYCLESISVVKKQLIAHGRVVHNIEEIFQAEEIQRSISNTLHHQPEFGRVTGDVRLQNSDEIAEHSAVRTDRNPRAGRIQFIDFSANVFQKIQRDLFSHIRRSAQNLL